MKVYNVRDDVLRVMAGGKIYNIPPKSEFDIYWNEHASHVCHAYAGHGLIHLDFTEPMQKKYGSYDKFKAAQILNGLQSYRKTVHAAWVNERQAVVDIKQNKGAEAEKELVNPDRFKEQLDAVDKEIDAAKSFISSLDGKGPDGADAEGVGPVKVDTQHDQGQSPAQAG